MQLTIDVPNVIVPNIQTIAKTNRQFNKQTNSPKQNFGQGWQQMYDALQEFEPDFVLERENEPEQMRQELI